MDYSDDEHHNYELCKLIMRQTDYDQNKAEEKLKEHNNDARKIIREYIGGTQREKTTKSTINQEIYSQIRELMDTASKTYREKQEWTQRREEWVAKNRDI